MPTAGAASTIWLWDVRGIETWFDHHAMVAIVSFLLDRSEIPEMNGDFWTIGKQCGNWYCSFVRKIRTMIVLVLNVFFFFFPAFSSLVWLHVFWICDSFSLLNNSVTPLATSTTVGISTSWDTHYPGMKVTLTRRFAEGIWYDSIADSFEVEWPWMTLQFVLGAHAVQLVTGVVCESWWWLYRPIEFI